jgi:hypothetical protein
MLARELERPIDPELYFAGRDLLLNQGRIGRLRGQGGQLFLTPLDAAAEPVSPIQASAWAEAALMKPLRGYLDGPFRQGLDLPSGSLFIAHDTSNFGPHRGQWARPDYIVITAMKFKLMPGSQVDVHSFELKTEGGCTVQSVHEALAQTRFTHFGHLVWHLPDGSKAEARLAEIEKHCEEHGVGLIRMREPSKPDKYEILLDPKRKRTLPSAVEGFLESRLTGGQRKDLSKAVNGVRE